MALLQGDLRITGNISAANYPPKMEDLDGVYQDTWDVTEPTQKDFPLVHGLGAKFLRCNVYDLDLNCEVFPNVEYTGIGRLTVHFAAAPGAGKRFKFVVSYHGETDNEEEE